MRTAAIHCPALPLCGWGWRKSCSGTHFSSQSSCPGWPAGTAWNGNTTAVLL